MSLAILVTEHRGCRVLLQRAPRGTPSGILALRLRRCFHHHHKASRPPICRTPPPPLYASRSVEPLPRYKRDTNGSVRYATTDSTPSLVSRDAVAHVQSLLAGPDTSLSRGAEPLGRRYTPKTPTGDGPVPAPHDIFTQSVNPFGRVLQAMQEGDTRRLLIRLAAIERMSRAELQDIVAAVPRTTFTEFFRALDPLRVARDCDPLDDTHTPVGMFKMLHMESIIDDWGVRKLYSRLLQHLLLLMQALQTAGYTLHPEEYISLFRCAGAASDISGAGAIWNHLVSGPALAWRNSEIYTEYIKARFLTEPLYTNYQKVTRMVTPRNLHRSRLQAHENAVRRLDALRLRVRSRKLRLGLNKEVGHVEELMRALRGHRPAVKLFRTVVGTHSFRLDESILCALMVALGRAGSLRFIGTQILEFYFGIKTPHPFPPKAEGERARVLKFSSEPPRIVPTARLMRAVVETYGSNAEIGVAIQLVEYLSNTYNIPISPDVWQDLLEWTYIMSSPPASTMWEMAGLYVKIPGPQAVEMIWNAMTSPPYNQIPTFKAYDILIRSLIPLHTDDFTPVLSRMREAIALYDAQCREYEATAFEYTQHLRDGIAPSAMILRFERARFKKQRMWYNISVWCRMLLKRIPFSKDSPAPNRFVPAFVQEFRPFLKNPVEYETPTGRVSLFDPVIERFHFVETRIIQQHVPMKDRRGTWKVRGLRNRVIAIQSSHSLAKFKPLKANDPLNLLAPRHDAFFISTPRLSFSR